MHGINASVIPEIKDGARLLGADSNIGGMRNLLPMSDSEMFGAGKDPRDLRTLMRKLSARISRDPPPSEEKRDPRPDEDKVLPEDNPNIPSGYTYLLQFLAHDMVNTSISLAATEGRRFGFQNARQQPLTLDTIYGGGPDVSPQAYEYSRLCERSRGFMPRTQLRCGRAQARSGSTAHMPFADIGRAVPTDISDDGLVDRKGAPRCLRTEALIADARNEDQALIAQLTLVFHRMHNFVLDQIDRALQPSTAPDAYRNFICARFILTLIYRKIIVKDVLYRLLDPSVYRYYFLPTTNPQNLLSDEKVIGQIPVEFSHGAFRCGHAMLRDSYRVKGAEAIDAGRAMHFNSRRSPGFVPLSEEWMVNWEHFFPLNGQPPVNLSRRLRPNFSSLARSEFYFAPLMPNSDENGDAPGLPNRDLVSAVFARIWSVPKLIDALRAKSAEKATDLVNFLPPYDEHVSGLTAWLKETANPGGISEQFDPEDIVAIAQDPPLPFFVLYEAQAKHHGQRLGLLGSIIIAETIAGAMQKYPLKVGSSPFDPLLQFKEQYEPLKRLGTPEGPLIRMPEIESFADLLMFMKSNGILEPEH
ncbi:peroxidase family protein [Bradyrhizobium sp.]|uniref:peroxidase family protein n=1 Tax=Bradyrhizobium sp. TaxID=376 RepID=UPI003C72BAF2